MRGLASSRTGSESTTARFLGHSEADKRASSNDAQKTLSGHTGRVMLIKTAWHGDGILSGGADRNVRLWVVGNFNNR
jgi:WD40 repeat protein